MEVRRCLGERVVDFLAGLGTVDDLYDEATEKGC